MGTCEDVGAVTVMSTPDTFCPAPTVICVGVDPLEIGAGTEGAGFEDVVVTGDEEGGVSVVPAPVIPLPPQPASKAQRNKIGPKRHTRNPSASEAIRTRSTLQSCN